jgi:hypothetical protein
LPVDLSVLPVRLRSSLATVADERCGSVSLLPVNDHVRRVAGNPNKAL